MSKLVIVESPTKAKTLATILGKEYEIKASMGHIRDLPSGGMNIDIEHDFTPNYDVPEKAKKVVDDLKKAVKGKDGVILATDPDREGEAISWHLKELLTPKTKKERDALTFDRVVFHELTKSAIEEAFSKPGKLDLNLVDAQQARRILDRLVGYSLSPILWQKVRYGLSAGRVQSVAVRIVVERERERKAFKAEEYWSVDAEFKDNKGKRPFTADLYEIQGKKLAVNNTDTATDIKTQLLEDQFVVESIKKVERKKNPYPPFKTSTLQQSMANVFGFSAKRTMDAAQKLFEKGFITYHRTDSLNLSPQFIEMARDYAAKEFGKQYLPETPNLYKTKSANAQEAHESIRPTSLERTPTGTYDLKDDEVKVYQVIWVRALESQMMPAIYDQTTINVLSAKGYAFRSSGSIVTFDGWLSVSKYVSIDEADEELKTLPEYKEGEVVTIDNINPVQHFTQPPARFSDATLIKQLEEIGVGRPSTYAPTITTILSRKYVERDGKYFVPTDFAYVVNDLLSAHFPDVVDYQFTALIEEQLDEIANGDREWVPVVREFYTPFKKELTDKIDTLKKTDFTTLEETDEKCPDCGKNLVIKLGKYGRFLSCSGFPDCKFAKPMVDESVDENGEKKDFGKCPNCEDGIFVLKTGKFGKFLACSNYPKCKTTKPFLVLIGVKCPKCKEGDVIVKKAKRKVFYGCSRYPDCDFSSWTKPVVPGQEVVSTLATPESPANSL